MSLEQLTEILKKYRSNKARLAYLQSQLEMLGRFLAKCQGEMIEDQVTMSQAITGMPHGTTVGDPCGRLAIDIASGKVTPFVRQIQDEIDQTRGEIISISPSVRTVEIVLGALKERERIVMEMKMIDELPWDQVLDGMNRQFNNSYSKRSLQRLLDRAVDTAYEIVK